ncbi:reverse transcriptase domain-containing protein [Tanacetum coccineum]
MKLNPKECSFGMEEGKFLGYIVTFEGIKAHPKKTKDVINMPSPSSLKQMQRLSGKLATLNTFMSKAAERVLPCLDTLKKYANKKDFHWTAAAKEAFNAMKKLIAKLPTLTTLMKDEQLMIYLSTSNEAVSIVLLVERNGRQILIYYVSKALQGAEVNYPPMEKLALALVHERAAGQDETSMEGKVPEVRRTTENQIPTAPSDKMNIWKLYTDGASGDHGSGAGLILIDPKGAEYYYALRLNLTNSNNDAEYEALFAGLRIAAKMKVEKMHAFVDSKLVASQVEGSYEARGKKSKKYREKVLEMVRSFSNFRISHILREENKKVDALRKLAAVQCKGLIKWVLIEELSERSVDMVKVNIIV